ncbi:MAG: YmdB family metallophosphoesterase [Phycisphaerales bacterium]|nr:YmdB family metallophosphoesterase [Phycisphaerae bacterium]NNF42046.1 YmdB family metallophosphoesterase [Phycisphaerales bacterium]NNM25643.1 YmdB family metallophosphoesterase [Phycisphaerales bacterium]
MGALTIAFLGDIFAAPGRRVVAQQLPNLRADHQPDIVIANAENAARGLGCSPSLYTKFRAMGIDAITLGDHVYRDASIAEILQRPDEPIARPANLPDAAVGRAYTRIPPGEGHTKSVFVITVLGRVFLNLPADSPFQAVDRVLTGLPEIDPIVIVEAHMEATSEKAALAHYLDGRVAAVIGTHTHVPTADARILSGGTAFITDVGMCGPYDSVIGRDKTAVVHHMSTGMYAPFGIGRGAEAMCGVLVEVEEHTGRARRVQRLEYAADPDQPPFA